MARRSHCRRARWAPIAGALALLGGSLAAAQPATPRPAETGPEAAAPPPPVLSSLRRELVRFDFEEAERAPYTMPPNFYRYIAPDQGFPRFGRMQLTSEVAHGGRWSFRFKVNGGSLSARVPTAVIPVLPGNDYGVTAWVRTEGLTHAAARLVAQLYDVDRRPITGSRVQSALLRTDGRWAQASVEVRGDYDAAADLVVELQVLQPQQFMSSSRGWDEPRLEDVSGWAWFDDVIVQQVPRIELSTDAPGNVVAAPDVPTVHAAVRDATTERLTGRLLVHDIDGNPVRRVSFELPQGAWQRSFNLAGLDHGWYRTELVVENPQQVVGRRSLDLVVLAPPERALREHRFGVVVPSLDSDDPVEVTRRLVRQIGATHALVPLWDDIEAAPPVESEALQETVDELLDRGVEVTLLLPGLARKLVQPAPTDTGDGAPNPAWREALRHAAMTFGLEVPRWLIGAPDSPESLELVVADQARLVLDAAETALAGIVPQPIFLLPWPAEHEPGPRARSRGYWMTVPYRVPPESLAAYAARWPIDDRPLYTTFERLPDAYAPQDRVVDLVLRGLHGWRAGLPRMAITAPWVMHDRRVGITPDPAFAAWRTLAHRLDGRAFGGTLPLAPGTHCWILTGPGLDDPALVAWTDRAEPGDAVIRLLLADGPVKVVDAFGGRRAVAPSDGVHTIALGPHPVFIEGIDAKMLAFRTGFAIEPSFLNARHQVHECEAVLTNPWNVSITGTLRILPPEGWRITPRSHRFTIAPGATAALPISAVFSQRAPTGTARVAAEVELTAERTHRFRVHTELTLGLENIELVAFWRVDRDEASGVDDLVITQSVTNHGQDPVVLYAYVAAPGVSRQRRPIGTLPPGQKTVRTFRVPDGVRLLSGQRIRIGVIDSDGARLNRIMQFPIFDSVAGADDL